MTGFFQTNTSRIVLNILACLVITASFILTPNIARAKAEIFVDLIGKKYQIVLDRAKNDKDDSISETLRPADPVYREIGSRIIDDLVRSLSSSETLRPEFMIHNSGDFNCRTKAGGAIIACDEALVAYLLSDGENGVQELAFVLAHEISHIFLESHRQATKGLVGADITARFVSSTILQATYKRKCLSGEIRLSQSSNAKPNFDGEQILGVYRTLQRALFPRWKRKLEDEADVFAVRLMSKAGYNPAAVPHFLASVGGVRDAAWRAERPLRLVNAGITGSLITCASGKGGIKNIVAGFFAGVGLGAVIETSFGQDHRSPINRASRLSTLIESLYANQTDSEAKLLMASLAGDSRITDAVAVSSGVWAYANRWAPLLNQSQPINDEVFRAARMRVNFVQGKYAEASLECPDIFATHNLALMCGVAFANLGQFENAESLLELRLDDKDIGPGSYYLVANILLFVGEKRRAFEIIRTGQMRYDSGKLLIAEIEMHQRNKDVGGVAGAIARCAFVKSSEIRTLCESFNVNR